VLGLVGAVRLRRLERTTGRRRRLFHAMAVRRVRSGRRGDTSQEVSPSPYC
jgi:hypothetical protein